VRELARSRKRQREAAEALPEPTRTPPLLSVESAWMRARWGDSGYGRTVDIPILGQSTAMARAVRRSRQSGGGGDLVRKKWSGGPIVAHHRSFAQEPKLINR
jgi:hypothetical protein